MVGTDTPWHTKPNAVLSNFILMSLCFSLNHGTVTAVLALASTDLGDTLGGTQSGVLYVLYTLTALTISSGLVQKFGSKWAMVSGLALYCPYVGSFLIATYLPSAKWYAAITGSAIGGVAAGYLWTAQGTFFAASAEIYAKAQGSTTMKATSWLAGVFATFYVGFEVLLKTASSALRNFGGNTLVFTIFTSCAVGSTIGMCFVRQPPTSAADKDNNSTPMASQWSRKITAAGRLLVSDRKMQLLTPMNAAFGFTAALMNYWVNGTPVKNALHGANVGYMAAITPGVATLLSMPYSWLGSLIGKRYLMIFGAFNYATIAFCILSMSQKKLESLGWGLAFLYVLGGSGRAVFEGTNKATFADFFPNDKEAAFANVIVQSGGASAWAFFVFPHLSKMVMGILTGGMAVLAGVCLFIAFEVHEREKKERDEAQEPLMDPARNV